MIDDIRLDLSGWTVRHNKWSDAEALQVWSDATSSQAGLVGPIKGKRQRRSLYYRMPPLVRAFGLFAYRYIIRRGFLDGRQGLVFFVLQTFWFRFLVDAKLLELQARQRAGDESLG